MTTKNLINIASNSLRPVKTHNDTHEVWVKVGNQMHLVTVSDLVDICGRHATTCPRLDLAIRKCDKQQASKDNV